MSSGGQQKPLEERVIAFAALCQAAKLVQDVARTSRCDEESMRASLYSIAVTDAEQTIDIFGSVDSLKLGLSSINAQLGGGKHPRSPELTRYVVSILALERKLAKRPDIMSILGERIGRLERQLQHFDLLDEQVLASIAAIYSDVISPLGPRIQVAGNVSFLQQPIVQHKVRALLLAGIRAAVLWRQLGGQRRQLVFSRIKYVNQANDFLNRVS